MPKSVTKIDSFQEPNRYSISEGASWHQNQSEIDADCDKRFFEIVLSLQQGLDF